MRFLPTLLQIVGIALVLATVCLFHIGVGTLLGGFLLIALGFLLESDDTP